MFGATQSGAKAYATVGMETGVLAANPHKLIVMLFEGALIAISTAIQYMNEGNIAEKGKAISKAILIIESGLRASLDKKAGGDIAQSLDALYDYMGKRLLEANLKNQVEMLKEVHGLLLELKTAWDAIGGDQAMPGAAEATQGKASPLAYDALAPNKKSFAST
jgi:flagellar protein FliS